MANSYKDITGDGSTTIFSFSFGYLDRSHIAVLVDGVAVAFSFTTDFTVEVTPAPAVDTNIRIQRTTPQTPVVDFNDGETLTEADLDRVSLQSLYLAQEAEDRLSATLQLGTDSKWDAEGNVVKNAADPVAAQDVATKNYVDTGVNSAKVLAETAATNAGISAGAAAVSQADAAASKADAETARDEAVAASTTAQAQAEIAVAAAASITSNFFETFAEAEAATIPAGIQRLSVKNGTYVDDYIYDATGTDLTTADSRTWSLLRVNGSVIDTTVSFLSTYTAARDT